MVDHIGAAGQQAPEPGTLFRSKDAAVTAENIEELLGKPGRFTLDDAGHICIITPPPRRDNFLVSFIRGYISGTQNERAAYREKERMYDRMSGLAKNIDFQRSIASALQNRKSAADTVEARQNLAAIGEKLRQYVATHKGGISTRAIRDMNRGVGDVVKAVNDSLPKAELFRSDDKGSFIYKNCPVNVFAFIDKNIDPDGATGVKNSPLFSKDGHMDKSAMAYVSQKLIGRCMINPADFDAFGLRNEAEGVQRILSRPTARVSAADQTELTQSLAMMLDRLKACLADFAGQAISSGKDPQMVAVMLHAMIRDICDSVDHTRKSRHALRNLFAERNMQERIRQLPDARKELRSRNEKANTQTPEYKTAGFVQEQTGCSQSDAIRTIVWLEMRTCPRAEDFKKYMELSSGFVPLGTCIAREKGLDNAEFNAELDAFGRMFKKVEGEMGERGTIMFEQAAAAQLALNPRHRQFLRSSAGTIAAGLDRIMAKEVHSSEKYENLKRMKKIFDNVQNILRDGVVGNAREEIARELSRQKLELLNELIG